MPSDRVEVLLIALDLFPAPPPGANGGKATVPVVELIKVVLDEE